MSKRTAVKNPNGSGYLIDDGSGYSIRYPSKAVAVAEIARLEKIEAEAIVIQAEQRAARLEAVKAYLAVCASRAAEKAAQRGLILRFARRAPPRMPPSSGSAAHPEACGPCLQGAGAGPQPASMNGESR